MEKKHTTAEEPEVRPPGETRRSTEEFLAVRSPSREVSEVREFLDATALARQARTRAVLVELQGAQPGAVFRIHVPSALIGRSGTADVALNDTTVSWEHARLTIANGIVWADDLSSRNGTFVNERRIEKRTPMSDGDYPCVGGGSTVFKLSMMGGLEEGVLRTLFELAQRDPLTGLYNRRYFEDRLHSEFLFARRQDTPLGLLFIDIDRFKQVNDTRGHAMGDAVLKLVASSIQRMMRSEDVLVRYGGEEFVAIVRAMSWRNLEILGTRVCRRVNALVFELSGHNFTVSVSVGGAYTDPNARCDSAEALLSLADQALYRAKASGGIRVSMV